ncbi:2-octaprenyl-6-methoxyphenyl hydroxylase [Alteromonas sp. H39]|uniref:2-octaprenyl-6-methoxyphenyl hydroxylase n=1 Tax=Alteromonas sp. H39 TaxID=3389876 RepID=UPI0039E0CC31
MDKKDVVIVGGGVVGSVLAAGLLAKTPFNVTLIDAHNPADDTPAPGFDNRVIALSRRTVNELAGLGITLAAASPEPIKHIQVTDKGAAGFCELTAANYNIPAFGQVVSLSALGELLPSFLDSPRFTHVAPDTVSMLTQQHDKVSLALASGDEVSADLCVLADGGRSGLSEQAGFTREQSPYGQCAIICNVQTSEPHSGNAFERFTEQGPLAFLPYPADFGDQTRKGHGFSVVWTVASEQRDELTSLSDARFTNELQQTFGYRQGRITQVGPRDSYPLILNTTRELISHRCVVVGNSAQTLHPIAGQGFNLGLRDVIGLVNSTVDTEDPGAYSVLDKYRHCREGDRQTTVKLTDALVRIFSNRYFPFLAGRNLGLLTLDLLPAVSQEFVRLTTGYGRQT